MAKLSTLAWSKRQEIQEKINDASFTKKKNKTVYGYKDHIAVDAKHEFVVDFACTPAHIYDSQLIDELISEKDGAIFADKACFLSLQEVVQAKRDFYIIKQDTFFWLTSLFFLTAFEA